jgi:monoamine oxidase
MILNDKYHKPHQWGFQSEWDTKYQNLLDNFNNLSDTDKMAFDKLDWWRYLVNNGISETDLEIRELLDSTDFGETIRNVSAFAGISEYAESSPKNEMDYHIEGGNGKIIEKLSEKIGLENIKLKHKVISVDQYKDIIKIQCENGSNWTADKVICTIPTYSVNKIIWKPVLPSDMIEALNELQYSRIVKTSVLFKERFWKDESFDMITDSTPHYFFHSTKNQKGLKGVLTSYATGDKAFMISKLNEKEKITEICNALKPAFGNVEEYVDKLVSYYWGSDQYSQGAYAIYDSKQWLPVRETLNQGHLNVFFAGEHLADWQGFMEGSVNTGEAAAYKILE